MNKKEIVITTTDYRRARFMINNIASVFPPKSAQAQAVIKTCEKIIMLYHFQKRGFAVAEPIKNQKNLHGQWLQNANLFFGVRHQRIR